MTAAEERERRANTFLEAVKALCPEYGVVCDGYSYNWASRELELSFRVIDVGRKVKP